MPGLHGTGLRPGQTQGRHDGLPDEVEVRVWDSSAEVRYLVLPFRPPGTEGLDEDTLAALVTRDHMIGVVR